MSTLRLAAFAALLAAPACTSALRCDAASATVSGEMRRDLVGAWHSMGGYSALSPTVYDFAADGSYTLIEPPGDGEDGAIRSGAWSVADDLLTLRGPTSARTTPIAVSETLLVGLGPDHRRVVCSGYGF